MIPFASPAPSTCAYNNAHIKFQPCSTFHCVQVGPRYELLHFLGSGSFSRVCAARDTATGTVVRTACCSALQVSVCVQYFLIYAVAGIISDGWQMALLQLPPLCTLATGGQSISCTATCGLQVALKRIPDVARNLDNARKVLREVCIQRRVAHPNIVQLHDAFYRPSATGALATH
jgi:serine/threonine protein kinase